MQTYRENPEGEENQRATRQHEREMFAVRMMSRPVDPLQCNLCGEVTDWTKAKTRRKLRHTDLGNSLRTDQTQWQCKHCLAWNEP